MECLECDISFPPYPAKCSSVLLPGGIKSFVLANCGHSGFDSIMDLQEWCTKVSTGILAVAALHRIVGSQPESDAVEQRLGSCDPDELVGMTHTLDIIDYNSEDPTISSSQDSFYNWLNANYSKLEIAFLTCDDRLYGFINSFSVIAKRQIENNNYDGKTFWHIVFKWRTKSIVEPLFIPGLGKVLSDCNIPIVIDAFRTFVTTGVTSYGKVNAVPFNNDFTFASLLNINSVSGPTTPGNHIYWICGRNQKWILGALFNGSDVNNYKLIVAVWDDTSGLYSLILFTTGFSTGNYAWHTMQRVGNRWALYVSAGPPIEGLIDGTNSTYAVESQDFSFGNIAFDLPEIENNAEIIWHAMHYYDSALGDVAIGDIFTGTPPAGSKFSYKFNAAVNPVAGQEIGQNPLQVFPENGQLVECFTNDGL